MIDRTVPLALDGYLYLSRMRERSGRQTCPLRVMGRRAVSLVGPEAARFFYDRESFDRQGVVPRNVQQTLFGNSAVHLLDATAHEHRKALFTSVLDAGGNERLVDSVLHAWDAHVADWRGRDVVLFDVSAEVLCAGVHAWAGMPLPDEEVAPTAADMVAMVDGFASAGPRYARARRARRRQEERVASVVGRARSGRVVVPDEAPVVRVARHRDEGGAFLDRHTAAVEMLNLLRPTTAVAWFVTYAAHALHHWPHERRLLLEGGPERAPAFAHEVRRFYPFAPFLAARAVRDLSYDGVRLRRDDLAVLDIFGQNHHPGLWEEPWRFSSERHLGRTPNMYDLVPQGGGDVHTGHRCPGEPVTVDLLGELSLRLARTRYSVPSQDLRVMRHRVPARVRSGMRIRLP